VPQTKGIASRSPFDPNNSSAEVVGLHIIVLDVLFLSDYYRIT
jgi:hypothetical protein